MTEIEKARFTLDCLAAFLQGYMRERPADLGIPMQLIREISRYLDELEKRE